MIIEIALGIALGSGMLGALGFWASRKQAAELAEEQLEQTSSSTEYSLEQKLRNAIYECERNAHACSQKINELCKGQLEVLETIGKPSYMEIKNKPLFLKYENTIDKEVRYYYMRDLKQDVEPTFMEESQKVALSYAEHIAIYKTKLDFFQRLKTSHQENLYRLKGVNSQSDQMQLLKKHRERLNELEQETQTDKEAVLAKLKLEVIADELDFQEECMRQYLELEAKYNLPEKSESGVDYKAKLESLIEHLEDEDPARP